jgi:hypothetical protein
MVRTNIKQIKYKHNMQQRCFFSKNHIFQKIGKNGLGKLFSENEKRTILKMSNFKKNLLIIDPHFFSMYNIKFMQLKSIISLCNNNRIIMWILFVGNYI